MAKRHHGNGFDTWEDPSRATLRRSPRILWVMRVMGFQPLPPKKLNNPRGPQHPQPPQKIYKNQKQNMKKLLKRGVRGVDGMGETIERFWRNMPTLLKHIATFPEHIALFPESIATFPGTRHYGKAPPCQRFRYMGGPLPSDNLKIAQNLAANARSRIHCNVSGMGHHGKAPPWQRFRYMGEPLPSDTPKITIWWVMRVMGFQPRPPHKN